MTATATFTYGKFVWFEHMSPDTPKAQAFYQALFGWKTNSVPMGDTPYPMIEQKGQGIGGYRKAGAGAPTHWICYVSVPDVDATFNAAKAAGCKVLQSPVDYGPGRMAVVADPTGAPVALWKGDDGDRADAPAATGEWFWTELWTTDEKKALKFYQGMFDYGVDTMKMTNGTYHVLTMGGVPRAGVMQGADPNGRSMWLPYVAVADCDATVSKALSLGGKSMVPPMDIEGVGRFSVIIDTQGAPIGVIKPAPRQQ